MLLPLGADLCIGRIYCRYRRSFPRESLRGGQGHSTSEHLEVSSVGLLGIQKRGISSLNHYRSKDAPGTWQVTREIIAKDGFGLRGINKGLVATILRHNVWNMIYFGLYHTGREYLPQYQVNI